MIQNRLHAATALLYATTALALLCGCATGAPKKPQPAPGNTELRVGIAPDYPPLCFQQGDHIIGAEADFAHLLAGELGIPLKITSLSREELIPALLEGRIDIIMAGLSITRNRKYRIAFSDAYYELGQMALIRDSDTQRYGTASNITSAATRIGVVKDSTGDIFVQKQCPNAKKVPYNSCQDAVWDLSPKRKQIDIVVCDGPAIRWFASANEADMLSVPTPFTREYLAWGLRRNDEHLLDDVNRILARWKEDGTAQHVLNRWIPAE